MNITKKYAIILAQDRGEVANDLMQRLEHIGYSVFMPEGSGSDIIIAVQNSIPCVVIMNVDFYEHDICQQITGTLNTSILYYSLTKVKRDLSFITASPYYDLITDVKDEKVLFVAIETAIYRHKLEENTLYYEWYFNLFNSINEAVIVIEEDSDIIFMNKAAEILTGWSKNEAAGKAMNEIIDLSFSKVKNDSDTVNRDFVKVSELAGYRDDLFLFTRTGSVTPVELNKTVLKDRSDKACGTVLIMNDITEKNWAETMLYKLFRIVEQSPISILITDHLGRIEFVNPKFTEIAGYGFDEILGHKANILKSGRHDNEFYSELWETIKSGKEWEGEFHNRKKNGDIYIESSSISSIVDQKGEISNYIAVKMDITERKKIYRELQDSEKRFKDISLSIADWVWEVDTNFEYIYVSGNVKKILEYEPEELIGESYFRYMPEEEAERIREIFSDIAAEKEPITDLDNWHLHKNGLEFCIRSNGVPVLDSEGKLSGYRGVNKDITKQIQSDIALKKSQMMLNEGQKIAKIGNWEFDVKSGEMYWSEQVYRLFERSPESGPPSYEEYITFYHQDNRDILQEQFKAAIETGLEFDTDFQLKLPGNKTAYMRTIIKARKDQDGHTKTLHGTIQDITQRKIAETTLRKSEQEIRSITENSSDIILFLDDRLTIKYANKSCEGLTVDDLLGNYIYDFISENDRADIKAILEGVITTGKKISYQSEFKVGNGNVIYFDNRAAPIRFDGKTTGLILNCRDVTEQKYEEQLKEQIVLDLGKRIKELRCLYELSNLIDRPGISLHEIFSGLVDLLPDAWQFPEIACAKITFDNDTFVTENFIETEWKQSADITVYKTKMGSVQVHYLENRQKSYEGPFLKEERDLIEALANRLSRTSEQKITENDLAMHQQHLEDLVNEKTAELKKISVAIEQSPTSVVITDSDGIIEYVNPRFCELFGYSAEEIIGKNYRFVIPLQNADELKKDLAESITAAKQWHGELRLVKKNDEIFWANAFLSPVMSEDNKLAHFIGMYEDITERKHAYEILRSNEERFRALVSNSNDLISVIDRKGLYTYASLSHKTILGYTPESLVGSRLLQKIHTSDKSQVNSIIDMVQAVKDVSLVVIFRHMHNDGSWRWIEGVVSCQLENPSINGIIINSRDITERKLIEDKLIRAMENSNAANKAKSEFLAIMSHEIRTPMNAIIGLTHLFEKTSLTTKQRNYINKISESSASLLRIINDILDFSKIEAGRLDVEFTDFNLERIFEKLSTQLLSRIEHKDIEIIFNIDKEVPLELRGDQVRLEQILLNLAGNAVKFTETGEVVVSVKKYGMNKNKVTLLFSVKDTGIGISDEIKSRLFNPFIQADSSFARKYNGTGLGLAISKQLVEMMNGTIDVTSKPGQGSEFTFTVDLHINLIAEKKYSPAKQFEGTAVLVIDNNDKSVLYLKNILERMSFYVVHTATVANGIVMLENSSDDAYFGLIFVDWKLSEMSGPEAVRRIRNREKNRSIPIVMMVTPYAVTNVITEADLAYANASIIKPVNPKSVEDTILEVFGIIPEINEEQSEVVELDELYVSKLSGSNILLVEDNGINREVAREILESAGINVYIAVNGNEALQKTEEMLFDCILMDIHMPSMDGMEATRVIRNKPRFAHIPIIAMTANAMKSDLEKYKKAGMNDYIFKPVVIEQMFKTLMKWVSPVNKKTKRARQPAENSLVDNSTFIRELKGIDVRTGLQRTRGNELLYGKLLLDFKNENTDIIEKISNAYNNNEYDRTEHLVHTLKGVAGNIGANKLYRAVTSLESAIVNKNEEEFALLLKDVSLNMTIVINAISGIEEVIKENIPQEKGPPKTEFNDDDLHKIKPLLETLKKLIADYDSESRTYFNTIQDSLDFVFLQEPLNKLKYSIEHYDFEGALVVLEQIYNMLQIKFKGKNDDG